VKTVLVSVELNVSVARIVGVVVNTDTDCTGVTVATVSVKVEVVSVNGTREVKVSAKLVNVGVIVPTVVLNWKTDSVALITWVLVVVTVVTVDVVSEANTVVGILVVDINDSVRETVLIATVNDSVDVVVS
jgi:hypothetical protein